MTDIREQITHSVIPAVPVPFNTDGEIDSDGMTAYALWMAAQQVGAVAIWAHTGRGLCLSDAHRALVLSAWREVAPDLPVVCGVGAPLKEDLPSEPEGRIDKVIAHTVEMAEAAKRGGASAVLVYPPTPLRDFTDIQSTTVELHRAVADVGLPVIVFYLYEGAGGVSYSLQTIAELLDTPGVIGIKVATLDSINTYQDIASVVRQSSDALLITGEDRFLGYSLMAGAEAALIGMAAACTSVMSKLLNVWFEEDYVGFQKLSAAIDSFARATFHSPMDGYVQRMLWALEFDGVLSSEFHDPFGPKMDKGERVAVKEAVEELRSI